MNGKDSAVHGLSFHGNVSTAMPEYTQEDILHAILGAQTEQDTEGAGEEPDRP
jgi:hypothetical protein